MEDVKYLLMVSAMLATIESHFFFVFNFFFLLFFSYSCPTFFSITAPYPILPVLKVQR